MPSTVWEALQVCGDRKQSSISHWYVRPTRKLLARFSVALLLPRLCIAVRNDSGEKDEGRCWSQVKLMGGTGGEVGDLMKNMWRGRLAEVVLSQQSDNNMLIKPVDALC